MKELASNLLELTYMIIGLQFLYTAFCVYKDITNHKRLGTTLFWFILSVIFIAGSYIPAVVTGALVVILSCLTLTKQVKIGKLPTFNEEKAKQSAEKLSNAIFIPVILLALIALVVAQFYADLGRVALSIAAISATVVALIVTKANPKLLLQENNRMVQQVSTSGILPQLLAALGAIFTAAGVGKVIASLIGSVVPADNRLFGVIAYVLGMVIFTMIMGNAFAAFTVITTGVGVPFVIALGANPVIAGALAMTAGYCGTLLTPMAANFNALPASLMNMKDKQGVIKAQLPIALIMIVVHIVLMYVWAF